MHGYGKLGGGKSRASSKMLGVLRHFFLATRYTQRVGCSSFCCGRLLLDSMVFELHGAVNMKGYDVLLNLSLGPRRSRSCYALHGCEVESFLWSEAKRVPLFERKPRLLSRPRAMEAEVLNCSHKGSRREAIYIESGIIRKMMSHVVKPQEPVFLRCPSLQDACRC